MEAFLSGVVAGYGIAIPVGAIAILIIQVGIKCGFGCAFAAGAGAATADLVYATVAVVGGAALAQQVDAIGDPLRYSSAGVLMIIAVSGLRKTRPDTDREIQFSYPDRSELAGTYARFLGLTVINPTTIVYFAAVVIGLGAVSGLTARAGVAFVLGAFLASLSWQTFLAFLGGLVRHRMTARSQRVALVLGNVMIIGMAVLILVW